MLFTKKCILLLIVCSLISGCDFYKTENKEEINFLGRVEGCNKKIEELQKSLKKSGFDPGPVDGKIGWKTRKAIKCFQKKTKLKQSGFVDLATQNALFSKESIKNPATSVATQVPVSPEIKKERPKVGNDLTPEIIKARLASAVWVKKIQQALKQAGIDPGPIDGKIGPKTKKAITVFQKLNGLNADGIIDQKTWERLAEYFQKKES